MNLPHLEFNKITYCGIRDIDDFEQSTIDKHKIRVLNAEDTCEFIRTVNKPMHISFDVDVMDPTLIDSTGTPVEGGLFADEVRDIIEAGLNSKNLVSLDVVEFNTELGDKEASFRNLKEVFLSSADSEYASDTA